MNNSVITNINCISGKITINGKTYENIYGDMTITDDGAILVNGKPIEEYKEPIRVEITIVGDVKDISTVNAPVNVDGGTVQTASTKNGNIVVKGNILGNAETGNGNITVAGSIRGEATTKNGYIIQ